jgi:hypothetical protein
MKTLNIALRNYECMSTPCAQVCLSEALGEVVIFITCLNGSADINYRSPKVVTCVCVCVCVLCLLKTETGYQHVEDNAIIQTWTI